MKKTFVICACFFILLMHQNFTTLQLQSSETLEQGVTGSQFLTTSPAMSLDFFETSSPLNPLQKKDPNIKNESDGVSIDGEGFVYSGHPFSGKRAFMGIELKSRGPQDALIVKIDPKTNQLEWYYIISSDDDSGIENIYDLVADKAGNVYVNGAFTHKLIFPAERTVSKKQIVLQSAGNNDHMVIKFTAMGLVEWAKRFGGTEEDGGNEISLIDEETLLVSAMSGPSQASQRLGITTATYSYDYYDKNGKKTPINFKTIEKDGFLLKLSTKQLNATADGPDVFMVKHFYGIGDQQIRAVGRDLKGRIFVGFEYDGEVYMDRILLGKSVPASSENIKAKAFRPETDGLVVALAPNGNFIWSRRLQSGGFDNMRGIGVDSSGLIYVTGVLSSGAKLETSKEKFTLSITTDGYSNQFLAQYSENGNLNWFRRYSTSPKLEMQPGGEIEVSEDDIVYLNGCFHSHLSLYNQLNAKKADVFVDVGNSSDSLSVLGYDNNGQIVDSFYISGSQGITRSSVIASRIVGDELRLALGIVSEGAGAVTISNTENFTYGVSELSREFGMTSFHKKRLSVPIEN